MSDAYFCADANDLFDSLPAFSPDGTKMLLSRNLSGEYVAGTFFLERFASEAILGTDTDGPKVCAGDVVPVEFNPDANVVGGLDG